MSNLSMEAEVSGFDDVLNGYERDAQQWLNGFTEDLVSQIKLSFGTSPAGEVYVRGNVSHVASQPGYPPNIDIGTLTGSIEWERVIALENHITVGAEHGEYMEDGTQSIAPRPFMKPAFDNAATRFEQEASSLNLEG